MGLGVGALHWDLSQFLNSLNHPHSEPLGKVIIMFYYHFLLRYNIFREVHTFEAYSSANVHTLNSPGWLALRSRNPTLPALSLTSHPLGVPLNGKYYPDFRRHRFIVLLSNTKHTLCDLLCLASFVRELHLWDPALLSCVVASHSFFYVVFYHRDKITFIEPFDGWWAFGEFPL